MAFLPFLPKPACVLRCVRNCVAETHGCPAVRARGRQHPRRRRRDDPLGRRPPALHRHDPGPPAAQPPVYGRRHDGSDPLDRDGEPQGGQRAACRADLHHRAALGRRLCVLSDGRQMGPSVVVAVLDAIGAVTSCVCFYFAL
eukprot:scaffold148577_cov33-Prasinocladus_malaysianus.AAC.1